MPTRRVTVAEVARVLQIIASRPNLRKRRRPGDLDGPFDEWFDGGAARTADGRVEFHLGDGTRAEVRDTEALAIHIAFRDGLAVTVAQS